MKLLLVLPVIRPDKLETHSTVLLITSWNFRQQWIYFQIISIFSTQAVPEPTSRI